MDLQETIHKTIKEIQETDCINCKSGKALIALKDLADRLGEPTPEKQKAASAARPQKRGPYKKRKTVSLRSSKKKQCRVCGKTKPLDAFQKHKECKDGYMSTCKECRRAKAKARKKQRAAEDTGSGEFPCTICKQILPSAARLQSHMRVIHRSVAA